MSPFRKLFLQPRSHQPNQYVRRVQNCLEVPTYDQLSRQNVLMVHVTIHTFHICRAYNSQWHVVNKRYCSFSIVFYRAQCPPQSICFKILVIIKLIYHSINSNQIKPMLIYYFFYIISKYLLCLLF